MKIHLASLFACVVFSWGAFAQAAPPQPASANGYSGMYTFLHEGEFVQLTVEDDGRLTGFVSRFGTLESDRGAFLDQFFKTASLKGTQVSFTTEVVHGTWYDFVGTLDRGEGKTRADEAYYVVKGKLTEHITDANNKETSSTRDVVFKGFPEDPGIQSGKRQ